MHFLIPLILNLHNIETIPTCCSVNLKSSELLSKLNVYLISIFPNLSKKLPDLSRVHEEKLKYQKGGKPTGPGKTLAAPLSCLIQRRLQRSGAVAAGLGEQSRSLIRAQGQILGPSCKRHARKRNLGPDSPTGSEPHPTIKGRKWSEKR